MHYILHTARMRLRKFTPDDADFIIELLNAPGWLRFIGDRNVRSVSQAITYLKEGPMKSYNDHGFGLYLVERKDPVAAIGMCGLLKRDSLEHPDIGFAFLPQYTGNGYAVEAAQATLLYAKEQLKIPTVAAITKADNQKSIRLLENIGLKCVREMKLEGTDEALLLYQSDTKAT